MKRKLLAYLLSFCMLMQPAEGIVYAAQVSDLSVLEEAEDVLMSDDAETVETENNETTQTAEKDEINEAETTDELKTEIEAIIEEITEIEERKEAVETETVETETTETEATEVETIAETVEAETEAAVTETEVEETEAEETEAEETETEETETIETDTEEATADTIETEAEETEIVETTEITNAVQFEETVSETEIEDANSALSITEGEFSLYASGNTIAVGETRTLTNTVSASPSYAPYKNLNVSYMWSSTQSSIVRCISNGSSCTITGVSAGTAYVECKLSLSYQYYDSRLKTWRSGYEQQFGSAYQITVEKKEVTAISLEPSSAELVIYKTLQLKPVFSPSGAGSSVTYTSSDTKVATVSNDGLVKAIGKGNATITVKTENGKTATSKISVYLPTATGVTLNNKNISLVKGKKQKLNYSLTPAGAEDTKLKWSSSDTKVAGVSSDGTVTAKKIGTATITVCINGNESSSASCVVTVRQNATKIKLDKTKLSMEKGGTLQLDYTIMPEDAADNITFTSSKPKIVKADNNGKLTAVGCGTSVITVQGELNVKAKCTVTVTKLADDITFDEKNVNIVVGQKLALPVTLSPIDATDKITWITDDKKIASVDKKGNVTGKKVGSTAIWATTQSGITRGCVVTVEPKAKKVKLDNTKLSLNKGDTYTLNCEIIPADAGGYNTFISSNDEVVSVDENGTLTAYKAGTVTITVKNTSKVQAKCKVTVIVPTVDLELEKESVDIIIGEKKLLPVTIYPEDTTDKITWESGDKKIATVDKKGTITGKKTGNTIISATTSSGITKICEVNVMEKAKKMQIPTALTMSRGTTQKLEVTFLPEGTGGGTNTFVSTDPNIVSVDEDGVLTANSLGTAAISVKNVAKLQASCIVTVVPSDATSIELNKHELSLFTGEKEQIFAEILSSDAVDTISFTGSAPLATMRQKQQ